MSTPEQRERFAEKNLRRRQSLATVGVRRFRDARFLRRVDMETAKHGRCVNGAFGQMSTPEFNERVVGTAGASRLP